MSGRGWNPPDTDRPRGGEVVVSDTTPGMSVADMDAFLTAHAQDNPDDDDTDNGGDAPDDDAEDPDAAWETMQDEGRFPGCV